MLNSTKSKIIATVAIILLFGAVTVVGIKQSDAREEAIKIEEAKEQERIEAIDKLNEGIVADFRAIKEGMDFEEVLELVGEPYQKDVTKANEEYSFEQEMWSYGGKGIVVFINGRVQMTSY